MEFRLLNRSKKHILLAILTAAILIVAVSLIMWYNGAFLPGWIEWKEVSQDTSFLKRGVKVQDTLNLDIDHDGSDELLVLCWRIGRYGDRKPFWVKHDEVKWSQHIYIYDENADGTYKPLWMASDIHTDVVRWEKYDENLIATFSPENEKSIWIWYSWGLEKMTEESLAEYEELKAKREQEKIGDSVEEQAETGEQTDDEVVKETEAEINPISIVMVGDVLLHDGVEASCKNDNGYDFSPLFENTRDVIEAADIAIVNQEVIIGGEELRVTGYPTFNAPYEVSDALVEAGFDVVCHATNHALDRKKKGIENCLNYWRENHPDIEILGIHESEEDSKDICIKEINGLKIAILNYTYGTNGIPLPEGMPYAVDLMNKEKVKSDLEYAEENADFTIVCPHWGIEYMLSENSEQNSMAEFMTENGADLIIGTHPHVIEPVKWIEPENGNRSLCYFSIGNFINWTSGRGRDVANRMVGGMAYIELDASSAGDNGSISNDCDLIDDFGVYPLVSHVEHSKGKVTTYFLQDYTEELASENAIIEQTSSFNLDYCKDLADDVFCENIKYFE